MISDIVSNDYFNWLYDYVCANRFDQHITYRKLLMRLHSTVFRYSIPRDENRAENGIELRHRFADDYLTVENAAEYLMEPCSVSEMMLGLAIQGEDFMDDPDYGDRTTQWFWGMIVNLGLGGMTDDRFNKREVDYIVDRFLNRNYEPNGKGGLFTIRNCEYDLRDVEIWVQLLWYLNSIS